MLERTYKFSVDAETIEKRLDRFLYRRIGAFSRMYLRRLIDENAATVNGAARAAGYHLQPGDKVEITFDDRALTAMTPEDLPLEIRFEDSEILVVNKPAGMLVHPTKNVKTGTLANALAFHLNFSPPEHADAERSRRNAENTNPKSQIPNPEAVRPGIVHRLDKETSGLMVVAKTARAHRILSGHFERKLVEKLYLAVVEGAAAENSGRINAPIGRVEEKPHWRVLETGKPAETEFRVLERSADATLLELKPVTGRTNQLRIHCARVGHPIVGDAWYGGREFSRLCLHAARLAFFHPNGGWLEFTCPPPDDFYCSLNGAQQL